MTTLNAVLAYLRENGQASTADTVSRAVRDMPFVDVDGDPVPVSWQEVTLRVPFVRDEDDPDQKWDHNKPADLDWSEAVENYHSWYGIDGSAVPQVELVSAGPVEPYLPPNLTTSPRRRAAGRQ